MSRPLPSPCPDFALALSLRASGPDALEPAEAAALDTHVATCAGCRAELDASAALLGALQPPAPSLREQVAAAALARTTRDAWVAQRRERSVRGRALGAAAALAAAAPVAFGVLPSRPAPSSPPLDDVAPASSEVALAMDAWASGGPRIDTSALDGPEEDGEVAVELSVNDLALYPHLEEELP